jgi:hypothetical protein
MNDTPELTPEQLAAMSDEDFDQYVTGLKRAFNDRVNEESRKIAEKRFEEDRERYNHYFKLDDDLTRRIFRMIEDRKAAHDE